MKFFCQAFAALLTFTVLVGCNPAKDQSEPEEVPKSQSISKKTQALLLTQPFEFDLSDKNRITGDYVAHTKLTIPDDLAPQNKWIMFEGPILENDLVGYRYYADSRHRFDIYAKSVTDLVMDTVGWQYHDIMNWGSDVLKVGNSLGIGSPAIWFKDTLYTLSNCAKKEIEILENGTDKSIIRTSFTNLDVAGHQLDLVQDWSIAAGDYSTIIHLTVTRGSLPEGAHFASGIVKLVDEVHSDINDGVFHAYTWGKQSFHGDFLGMAILAKESAKPRPIEDELSHAYAFEGSQQEVEYAFLSAWEKGNSKVQSEEQFLHIVKKHYR